MGARSFRGAALAATLLLVPASAASAADLPTLSLADANRRWAGATCTLRYAVPIKDRVDREGASRSPLFQVATPRGEPQLHVVFTVSNRAALRGVLRDGEIPAGTAFVARGWDASSPATGKGLGLQLRFRDAPVELRVGFLGRNPSPDSFPLDRLYQVEKYLRIDAFQLRAADEQLTEVAPAGRAESGAPAAPVASALPPPAPRAASTVAPFAARLHAAAVRPARVTVGGEVELVLSYELLGGAGVPGEVRERREIRLGERVLKTLESTVARAGGPHTSSQRLRLPASLAPGIYSLRGSVVVGGAESEAVALFEVTAAPP